MRKRHHLYLSPKSKTLDIFKTILADEQKMSYANQYLTQAYGSQLKNRVQQKLGQSLKTEQIIWNMKWQIKLEKF